MPLKDYIAKRDFRKTPEPRGVETGTPGTARRFVVQKHAASNLHYDLRLELGGTLKSWAVPKGPSHLPREKRLAVHVEDHPLEYLTFEGVIPADAYGGGTVMVWDIGVWRLLHDADADESYRDGQLKLWLYGSKLRGGWALVRTRRRDGERQDHWLLIKERDRAAVGTADEDDVLVRAPHSAITGRTMDEIATAAPGPLDPSAVAGARRAGMAPPKRPQLATLAEIPPTGDKWVHEVKFDGYRLVSVKRGKAVTLLTRNGNDWTERFPRVAAEVARLPAEHACIDGEATVLRDDGVTDFQALQRVLQTPAEQRPIVYYAFDLLHLGDYDLTRAPLLERKTLLAALLARGAADPLVLRLSEHLVGDGADVFQRVCALGAEGVISKRGDAAYEPRRSQTWLKAKCRQRQEFVIGGFTEPKGTRAGFGALVLGCYDDSGLRFCGKVGSGFDDALLVSLRKTLEGLRRATPALQQPPTGAEARDVRWVSPELVVEVSFADWTDEGVVRFPVFEALRQGKSPRQVQRERTAPKASASGVTHDPSATAVAARDVVSGVRLTNPERVYYPEARLTKRDIAAYYAYIVDWILPHVVRRPLSVLRMPRGVEAQGFFQKHLNESLPDAISGVEIEEGGARQRYICIADETALITLVQLGTLELHPWGARADKPNRPDLMTFDLDPGDGVAWPVAIEAAQGLRYELDQCGLQSFVKTSGGKGLHVVVPLTRRHTWEDVKDFSRRVVLRIAAAAPKHFVTTSSKTARKGKIYLDYLRNAQGATSVAAYSTRARPGAAVSTPVSWDELPTVPGPTHFTVMNVPQRLAALSADPWDGYETVRQSITRAAWRRFEVA